MYSSIRLVLPSALVLILSLTACNQETAGGVSQRQEATPPAASTAPQLPAPLTVASMGVGRYVEPKTFAVGGIGTRFKQSDRLFAMVQLQGAAPSASVSVSMIDASGQTLAEQTKMVQPKGPMKVNFSLVAEGAEPLPPGNYQVEVALDGQIATSADIVIE